MGSLSLTSANHDHAVTGVLLSVTPTNNFKDVVVKVGGDSGDPTPFGTSSATPNTWDSGGQSCQSITKDEVWSPLSGVGALASAPIPKFFAAQSVPIPIKTLQTSNTVVIGVSGPTGTNAAQPRCGIPDTFADGVTCTNPGSWSGNITLKRVHAG